MSYVTVKKHTGVVYYESAHRIFKGRPDRCFYILYTTEGRRRREKVGWLSEGINAQLAANVRAERVRDIRLGKGVQPIRCTLDQAWAKYREWATTEHKHPKDAIGRYKHLAPQLGHRQIGDISPLDLERLKIELGKAGYSRETIKHVLGLLRAIVNKAIAWGMWSGKNPVAAVEIPKPQNARERFLSREEATELLKALAKRSQDVHDMALLSLSTGMRLGEITALRWECLDLESGTISVIASGEHMDTKGGGGRVAYMTQEVRDMFMRRSGSGLVFAAQGGGQIADLSKTFGRVVEGLGLNAGITDRRQRVTFHTLRHTFASWLAIAGTPVLTIRDLLGHKSLAMTERYAKLIPDARQAAIKSLPRLAGLGSEPDSSRETS